MASHIPSLSVALDRFTNMFSQPDNTKPQVVVVGSGWGASSFIDDIDRTKYKVKVISTSDARLNQPRMISDLTPSYKRLKITPILDTCVSVNKIDRTLVGIKSTYNYDYLVVAVGSEPNDFNTKGVAEHCLMFKSAEHLDQLKSRIIDQTHVTVIGAGPTGIELAFKLQLLGHTVTLFEAAGTVLPGFSMQMQAETYKQLEDRKITVKLNTKITEITESSIITPIDILPRDKVTIWTCGIKPVAFARAMAPNGRAFTTNGFLMADKNIYAIGDVVAGYGPPTAQNAKQQGAFLAHHFNNNFEGKSPYKYNEKGRVIDTGSGLIVEYNGKLLNLPGIFRSVFYCIAD